MTPDVDDGDVWLVVSGGADERVPVADERTDLDTGFGEQSGQSFALTTPSVGGLTVSGKKLDLLFVDYFRVLDGKIIECEAVVTRST